MNDTAHTETDIVDEPSNEVQFFDIYRTITAGEKIQILRQLDISEVALEQAPSTPNTIAVVWKYLKSIGKPVGIAYLLGLTETELLDELGLTDDQVVEQFAAKFEAAETHTKSHDD